MSSAGSPENVPHQGRSDSYRRPSGSSPNQPRPDPYKRTPLACNPCRKRKTKCLGGNPCQRCAQVGQRCTYALTDRKVLVSERYLNELEARARLHHRVKNQPGLLPGTQEQAGPSANPGLLNDDSAIDDSWLEELQDLKISEASSIKWGMQIRDFVRPASVNQELNLQFGSRPYDESSWPRRNSVSIMPQLPPYDFARRLFAVQHTYIGTIFAFLRPDDFQTRLDWIYSQMPDFEDLEDRLIYAQILMIFAYGTMYSVNQWAGNEGPPGFNYFVQALEILPNLHEDGSILFVEVLGLVGYYMQNLTRYDAAFLYIGTALRMAISLGLHQESADPAMDNAEREHRRRVWWSVYSMDRIICIKSGNPITIADQDIGVQLPSPLPGVESDNYPANVLARYTELSKILGGIMESFYRKSQNSGPNLKAAVSRIIYQLETWFQALPEHIRHDYFNLDKPIPRESVSIFLHYHQCVNMAARPFLFHIIRKRLRTNASFTTDWRVGLLPDVVKIIEKCIACARGSITMMAEAFKHNLVATYGFMDGEHAFSAALTLVMSNLAFPYDPTSAAAEEAGLELLRGMADKGNNHTRARLSMLLDLKANPDKPPASTDSPFTVDTTTMESMNAPQVVGPMDPLTDYPGTFPYESMTFSDDFNAVFPETVSGHVASHITFESIEEALMGTNTLPPRDNQSS